MCIRISKDGAKFDLGTGFAALSSVGAIMIPLFIVIDALSGTLTSGLPSLFLACVLGAVVSGILTARPFAAVAALANSLLLGALLLTVVFLLASFDVGVSGPKTTSIWVTGVSLSAAVLLLATSRGLFRLAQRRGELVTIDSSDR